MRGVVRQQVVIQYGKGVDVGLRKCPDCGQDVSDQAPSCIHCGRPFAQDLVEKPSAGSSEAHKAGRQRSKLRNDLGNAIGLVSVAVSVFIGAAAGSFMVGVIAAIAGISFGLWVAYGS